MSHPYIAMCLSIIPGLGQLYNKETGKAILFFLGCIIAWELFPLFSILIWIYGLFDAYFVAKNISSKNSESQIIFLSSSSNNSSRELDSLNHINEDEVQRIEIDEIKPKFDNISFNSQEEDAIIDLLEKEEIKIIEHPFFLNTMAYKLSKGDETSFRVYLKDECLKNEEVFQKLFSLLSSDDLNIRKEVTEIFQNNPKLFPKLIDIYEKNIRLNPKIGVLAGRILGRYIFKKFPKDVWSIPGETSQIALGVNISFVNCICANCGNVNFGIPVPSKGRSGFYSQKDTLFGKFHLPVLCDYCGKEFFIAWDDNPCSMRDFGYS